MPHAQHFFLNIVCIGARAVGEHTACAGHGRDALGQHAARAALRRSHRKAPCGQLLHYHFLQRIRVHGIDAIAQDIVKMLRIVQTHAPGLVLRRGLGRDADNDLGRLGIDGGRWVGVFQQMADPAFQMALAHACDAQRHRVQHAVAHGSQPRLDAVQEHGLQLLRRAGQQHGIFAGRGLVLEDHARRSAVGIGDLAAMGGHHGLLFVVFRHRAAPCREKRADLLQLRFIKAQRVAESAGHDLFGQVVLRGAEPAGKHQQVAAAACLAHHAFQPGGIVAHHCLKVHGNAQRRKFTAQKLRVRIQDIAQQQLGADGNDLSFHIRHPLVCRK